MVLVLNYSRISCIQKSYEYHVIIVLSRSYEVSFKNYKYIVASQINLENDIIDIILSTVRIK